MTDFHFFKPMFTTIGWLANVYFGPSFGVLTVFFWGTFVKPVTNHYISPSLWSHQRTVDKQQSLTCVQARHGRSIVPFSQPLAGPLELGHRTLYPCRPFLPRLHPPWKCRCVCRWPRRCPCCPRWSWWHGYRPCCTASLSQSPPFWVGPTSPHSQRRWDLTKQMNKFNPRDINLHGLIHMQNLWI